MKKIKDLLYLAEMKRYNYHMKLLLTSAGITNQSIANALLELTSKPAHETNLVFILTAAIFNDDKSWLIRNMVQFKDMGFRLFDIMDIAAVEKSNWLPRLQQADVICFGGGNEMHLAEILKSRGISEELPELLKTRVYVGISAGSMVASQTTDPKIIKIVYPEEDITDQPADSLGFVDLVFFIFIFI